MIEAEWLNATNCSSQLFFLEAMKSGDDRRLRLFGCACCRRISRLMNIELARRVVELAEAYADGQAAATDLHTLNASPDFLTFDERVSGSTATGPQISKLTHNLIEAARWLASAVFDATSAVMCGGLAASDPKKDFFFDPKRCMGGADVPSEDCELAEQVKLLHDIFGNPFRPVTFDPAWRTENTVGIAAKMYDERDFLGVPILADALQDAGCEDEVILSHCREPGVHVRGCWVVDLVLDKQ